MLLRCCDILYLLHILHSRLLLRVLHLLLPRGHYVLCLLGPLRNVLLVLVRLGYSHHHWSLLHGLLRIHILTTRRLRRGRRLLGRLITVCSTRKIDLIELPSIAPESEFYCSACRPGNLVTQNIQALPVNIVAVDELQHIARLNAITLVGGAALDKALDVHQHAAAAGVDSLPELDSHTAELSAIGYGCRGRSRSWSRLLHELRRVRDLHRAASGSHGLIILYWRLLHGHC